MRSKTLFVATALAAVSAAQADVKPADRYVSGERAKAPDVQSKRPDVRPQSKIMEYLHEKALSADLDKASQPKGPATGVLYTSTFD